VSPSSDARAKLRIVHAIEGLHPDRGGPPVVAISVAAAQARLGHDVTIVSEEPGCGPGGTDELIRATRDADRVKIELVPKTKLFAALYGHFNKVSKALAHAPDLLHAHGVWNPIALAASRAARVLRVPYLISSHGAMHPEMLKLGAKKKRAALALGWRRMLRDARRVLVLNTEERDEVNRLARREVAAIVPNGFDIEALTIPQLGLFRNTFAPLGGRPYFVYLGRLDRVKGLDALLESYLIARSMGSQADLVLIGPDWGERKSLEAAARTANVQDHVHFTGPLYDHTKLTALRDAIATVHRPRYEGFGMAVLEAMAVGTPAIVGDRCLLPVDGEREGVLIIRDDAREFAGQMVALERDSARRGTLGEAARTCVARRFDWTAIGRQTILEAHLLGASDPAERSR
jgi:glycosyltransferase involved in cell wall biosynthesis